MIIKLGFINKPETFFFVGWIISGLTLFPLINNKPPDILFALGGGIIATAIFAFVRKKLFR
ncbi:MAG: hypothetical protein KKF46_00510 [Nanoarchaeota archaeon]|nr:hypothetical protein [Nanoarchaeota archaeon]MBU1320816.1 hypothetical protein [Nanoarchaeota archaeon]MBU1596826.1 hypothetical protein [Nanoarchaeota archaeon]MBU2440894.1 hypothetical protein [Nanoarchaeota archaeon]